MHVLMDQRVFFLNASKLREKPSIFQKAKTKWRIQFVGLFHYIIFVSITYLVITINSKQLKINFMSTKKLLFAAAVMLVVALNFLNEKESASEHDEYYALRKDEVTNQCT